MGARKANQWLGLLAREPHSMGLPIQVLRLNPGTEADCYDGDVRVRNRSPHGSVVVL